MDTFEENRLPDLLKEPTDTSDKIAKILKYKEEGYLFHGSPNPDISVLEPRQANDTKEKPFNTDTAVYASSNPQVCIAGIVKNSFKGLNGSWNMGCYEEASLTAEIPKSWKQFVEKALGTLYVLPSKSFTKGNMNGWQEKSLQSIVPVDRINVTFDDFIALGGKVVWKEDE